MTEEVKVETAVNPPATEVKTEKVDKDISYREILKTLDIDEEERKFLQEQYKAQLSSKVAENEKKYLKKDFYNQVTELRATKKAEEMLKEKITKDEELLKEKGYTPLKDEEIKTLLDNKIFNITTDKDLFEKAKTNGILASQIRETYSSFAERKLASEINVNDSKTSDNEVTDIDRKRFKELDLMKNKGFSNDKERQEYSTLLEKIIKNKQ
jgi:hypothetical protein